MSFGICKMGLSTTKTVTTPEKNSPKYLAWIILENVPSLMAVEVPIAR
jgi:hypothetical protein